LQLRVDAVGFDDALAVALAAAVTVGVAEAVVVAGAADVLGFAAAFGDVLAWGRADARATEPPAALTTWIMADAAASALPVPPMPNCAGLLRLAGCAASESWADCGLPLPARP
jgi:hypothetical protein